MTLWYGKAFHITGPLWGDSKMILYTLPFTSFDFNNPSEETVKLPVIWYRWTPMWAHCKCIPPTGSLLKTRYCCLFSLHRIPTAAREVVLWMEDKTTVDSFTVPLHSPNSRHLPAVRTVQRDCHWGLKNGGNSHWSREPITQRGTRQSQSIFRPANHKSVVSYLTGSPIATRLGLCSRLKQQGISISSPVYKITQGGGLLKHYSFISPSRKF